MTYIPLVKRKRETSRLVSRSYARDRSWIGSFNLDLPCLCVPSSSLFNRIDLCEGFVCVEAAGKKAFLSIGTFSRDRLHTHITRWPIQRQYSKQLHYATPMKRVALTIPGVFQGILSFPPGMFPTNPCRFRSYHIPCTSLAT